MLYGRQPGLLSRLYTRSPFDRQISVVYLNNICRTEPTLLPKIHRRFPRQTTKETIEIRRIIERQLVGDLGHTKGGMEQQALRLQQNTLPNKSPRRFTCFSF